ncbi:MAG: hypothetical protein IMZ66_05755 [Planctomycetes bacterium]|nr:hypothetical protein [Planctomycetota bacterium]
MASHVLAAFGFPAAALILAAALASSAAARTSPVPLPEHPGNVFLEGEAAAVTVPVLDAASWEVVDYDGKKVAEGRTTSGRAEIGPLPVGWYEVRWGGAGGAPTGRAALAVLARLATPTPPDSPIACDVAMAWFYPEDRMPAAASLAALAGVNWVRDRLAWGHMEPKRGEYSPPNKYDASARVQAEAGLKVLQVNHSSPGWAGPDGKRFPPDLRDAYAFHREMARRWKGQVLAFEPWNEADIDVFGGHTGAEMASLQKASYLGLKAGDPKVVACLNVFASPNRAILDDLHANEAWPYFDTFNLHHYADVDAYPAIYAAFRAASAGRPLWVTEFARPVPWSGDDKAKEPSEADLRVQAERVAQVFAASLFEGPEAAFYFLLPHYTEGQTQFGIVRADLTPRPAYVALAAVGRLLAGARPVGRVAGAPDAVRAFVFRARPDGREADVLVAWTAEGQADLPLPAVPEAVFDHLGRSQEVGVIEWDDTDEQGRIIAHGQWAAPLHLARAPVFALLPAGAAAKMKLAPPPATPPRLEGQPSPVVFQARWPKERVALGRSAYRLSSEKAETIPLSVYNFAEGPLEGRLAVAGPAGWKVGLPETVRIEPRGKVDLALTVDCQGTAAHLTETIRVTGDFGPAGRPVLSLVVMPEPLRFGPADALPVPDADRADRWQPQASEGTDLKMEPRGKGLAVIARLGGGDRWVYPALELAEGMRPPAGCVGIQATLTLDEGEGVFRAVFSEAGDSAYVADFLVQPEPGKPIEAVALFEGAVHGAGWSKPDPNGRLDAGEIRAMAIGCNPKTERLAFRIENVRWLRGKEATGGTP